jgi:hypothetical protein
MNITAVSTPAKRTPPILQSSGNPSHASHAAHHDVQQAERVKEHGVVSKRVLFRGYAGPYATDVLFRSHRAPEEWMPRLLTYSTPHLPERRNA